MHDSRPATETILDLARSRMELVRNVHRVHVAIISSNDETGVLQFDDADFEQMTEHAIPALVRDTQARGVILSSPTTLHQPREGMLVAVMERALTMFYVPVVRISNADLLVGDFRPTAAVDPERFVPILRALAMNRHADTSA